MSPFKELKDEKHIFSQNFVSAISLNPNKKNAGGAANSLTVQITERHMILKSPLLFSAFADATDLLNIIPLENIINIKTEQAFLRSKLYIEFMRKNGQKTEIVLRSKKNAEIENILRELTKKR